MKTGKRRNVGESQSLLLINLSIYGVQDQRQAILWVRQNAARLHIDLERVMIFGESAGAAGVSSHLVALRRLELSREAFPPWNRSISTEISLRHSRSDHEIHGRSRGLFSRATMESGPFARWTSQPMELAVARSDALARCEPFMMS
jgi:acetyl esterase/lipase